MTVVVKQSRRSTLHEWRSAGRPAVASLFTAGMLAERRFLEAVRRWASMNDDARAWPRDPHGHVFLLRAVQEAGLAMFGAEWEEGKPTTKEAWDRMLAIENKILEALEAGEITAACRPKSGGAMVNLSTDAWRLDDPGSRFSDGHMDPSDPLEQRKVVWSGHRAIYKQDDAYQWIFVTRASLNQLIVRLRPTATSASGTSTVTRFPDRRKPGPAPGSVDRFSDADRALFPEIRNLMEGQYLSVTEAAAKLAEKIAGIGTEKSRVRRLADRFRAEQDQN